MAEKDVSEKLLEAHNDVFSDIVNGLLFQGEKVIAPDELETHFTVASYESKGKLRSMERDVSKHWKKGAIRLACIGLENQTKVDADMPLRIIAYDGAEYKRQLLSNSPERYPVITLVLYFGTERKWKRPRSLLERIKISEELKPFVNDYKINVFEIASLTPEQVKLFQSDFHVIADYLTQMKRQQAYTPSKQPLTHPEETFQMMKQLTGNKDYEKLLLPEEGGPVTMYDALAEAKKEGIAQGKREMYDALAEAKKEGIAQGIVQGKSEMYNALLIAAKKLKEKGTLSDKDIADVTSLPLEKVQAIVV